MAKILVSMDDRLVRRIDARARRSGLSRSAFLSQVVERSLGASSGPGADRRVRANLARLEDLFRRRRAPEDSTKAVRAERDGR